MTPQETLQHTEKMIAQLEELKRKAVFVGLPKEKVGGKVYGDGMTVIRIGAIHEYGAKIKHPGGTRYVIGPDGNARFVSNSFVGPVTGVTKPHTITIPQRSFLRVPFRTKRKEVNQFIAKQFEAVSNGDISPDIGLGRIGVMTANISKGAFTSLGYGEWKPITAETVRRKGSSQTLIDTGILRSSITWVVRDAS